MIYLLRNELAQSGFLCEPFPRKSRDRVPPYLHGTLLASDADLSVRYDIGFWTESDRMLNRQFPLDQFRFQKHLHSASFRLLVGLLRGLGVRHVGET
jgi:hypothetical protein